MEGVAGERGRVPVQSGRGVEAVGPQLHAGAVGRADELGEGDRVCTDVHLAVGEAHRGRVGGPAAWARIAAVFALAPLAPLGEAAQCELRQAHADRARGGGRGLAVEVGAGGGRGGRGVGHLAGVGGGGAHALERDAELGGDHLADLGVQALAHLGTAVVYQHRAVGIHMHQRAGLVQVGEVEGDAELHRGERQPAPQHRSGGVEGGDLGAAGAVVAARFEFVDQRVQHVVGDHLAVGRGVAPRAAVEVGAAHVEGIAPERARDAVDHPLGEDRALRSAEAAEGGVGLGVGAREPGTEVGRRQVVGVVDMAERARGDRAAEVGGAARARDHVDAQREEAALFVVTDGVVVVEVVALAGDGDVVVAIGAQLDRTAKSRRRQRRHAGEQRRLRLLAAEAAAHAAHLHDHAVGGDAQAVRHHLLHLARVLGGTPHLQAAVLARLGERDLAFEVEVLLAADLPSPLHAMRRRGQRRIDVATHEAHRRQHELARACGLQRVEPRRQRCVVDAGAARGAARGVALVCDHREDRLADVVHFACGEDGVVVHDRPAVVASRNVGGHQHAEHAGRREHRAEVHRHDARVRLRRQAERRVCGAGGFGEVVDVGGLAGHVQVGGLVRMRLAGGGGGCRR